MNKSYLRNTSGQFSIMLAVSLTTLLIGIGAAVDFTGVTRLETKLQNYADMAVLAAAATGEKEQNLLEAEAQKSVNGNNALGVTLTPKVSTTDTTVQVELSTPYHSKIMGMFHQGKVPVKVIAESPLAQEAKVNIALVLDSTYSMKGANLDSLKEAAVDFVEMFEDSEETKIGIVPFSDYVNVGTSNQNANWLKIKSEQVCSWKRNLVRPELCKDVPRTGTKDGQPVSWTSTSCPDAAYNGPAIKVCEMPPWNGCVGSRVGKWHKQPAYKGKPIIGLTTKQSGTKVLSCGRALQPLTNDTKKLKSLVNSLYPRGETYIPAGLIWGWRLLHKSKPFADNSNGDKDRQRIMVLMTDGSNTLSISPPHHHEKKDAAASDKLTAELCAGIKEDGITVYSVAYKLAGANATSKSIIKGCASTSSNFYDAQNAQELKDAFKNIGRSLYAVRLSR